MRGLHHDAKLASGGNIGRSGGNCLLIACMQNALTFDLEEYFQVSAFADQVARENWNNLTSRVQRTTENLLELLAAHNCSATFFTLGWLAKKYPHLVRKIAEFGHEIGCHSLEHRLVYQMKPAEFREDTREAKELLENASGHHVRGYRAPSFSITTESFWAFQVLAELGFTYDSSIFPVRHPNYGIPEAPRFPFLIQTSKGNVLEFPLPTVTLRNWHSPIGGGAYLRVLPYWYTRWGLRYINEREARAICVYLHPWELDADQPRMQGSLTSRLRHYMGLRGAEQKLRRLLNDFEFVPLGVLASQNLTPERVLRLDDNHT
jgi:polysaccharide deacetylase family protein (PEP-CTERM system associated)